MARTVAELVEEARRLPENERATLVGVLARDLDGAAEPDVEEAWRVEIDRRLAEMDAGMGHSVPWSEVSEQIRTRFGI